MQIEDTFYLGKITRLYSFKGEVIVFLDVDDPSKYENLDAMLVNMAGALVPLFIERTTSSSHGKIRVKFEGVDDESSAKRLLNKELRLPLSLLPPSPEGEFYLHEVVGYQVVDVSEGDVGLVDSIIEAPTNSLFRILRGYDEILIPISENIIEKVDKKAKIIYVDCPEGLIDMNSSTEE